MTNTETSVPLPPLSEGASWLANYDTGRMAKFDKHAWLERGPDEAAVRRLVDKERMLAAAMVRDHGLAVQLRAALSTGFSAFKPSSSPHTSFAAANAAGDGAAVAAALKFLQPLLKGEKEKRKFDTTRSVMNLKKISLHKIDAALEACR